MHRFYRCTIWFLSLLFQQHLSDLYVSVFQFASSQGAQLRSRVGCSCLSLPFPTILFQSVGTPRSKHRKHWPRGGLRKGMIPNVSPKLRSMDVFAFEHLKWFNLVLISLHAQILLLYWKNAMTAMPAGRCSLDSSKLGWIATSAFHTARVCCHSWGFGGAVKQAGENRQR